MHGLSRLLGHHDDGELRDTGRQHAISLSETGLRANASLACLPRLCALPAPE